MAKSKQTPTSQSARCESSPLVDRDGQFIRDVLQQNPDSIGLAKAAGAQARSWPLNLFSLEDSFGVPMCCTKKRNGICSAISSARLISSMASIRPARSVDAMFTGGAPVRPTHNRHTKVNVRSLEEPHFHGTIPQFLLRGLAIGIIQMLPRREDFNRLHPLRTIRPAAPDAVAPLRTNTLKLLSACVSLRLLIDDY